MASTNQSAREISGVIGFFNDPHELVKAMCKLRQANYENFDAFTPYPIHGMDAAQGLKRSWIPFATLGAGMCGLSVAFLLQWWTSSQDWPIIVGGKPYNSLPAFIPIMFELTVLLAGLTSAAAMFIVNQLPNVTKKAFDPSITADRFALFVEAPRGVKRDEHGHLDEEAAAKRSQIESKYKEFEEKEVQGFLQGIGAKETRTVFVEGWF